MTAAGIGALVAVQAWVATIVTIYVVEEVKQSVRARLP